MPKGNSSKRGLINVALNGLVSTGVIAGFRTNYATREEPDQVQITVTSPSGARQESIRAKVLQALGEIGKGAKIVVEPTGGQPTGPMTPRLGRSRSRRDFRQPHHPARRNGDSNRAAIGSTTYMLLGRHLARSIQVRLAAPFRVSSRGSAFLGGRSSSRAAST